MTDAATRQKREALLHANGWERLLDRADIWIDTRADRDNIHDVHTFHSAYSTACIRIEKRNRMKKKRAASVHHHPGRLAA